MESLPLRDAAQILAREPLAVSGNKPKISRQKEAQGVLPLLFERKGGRVIARTASDVTMNTLPKVKDSPVLASAL